MNPQQSPEGPVPPESSAVPTAQVASDLGRIDESLESLEPPVAAESPVVAATSDAACDPLVAEAPLPVVIGVDGKWFRLGERTVDLSRRRPLSRILWAMAQGPSMPASDLIAAGWPGERIVRHAARIRLRVAVATLRSMGLATHIQTTRTGYALACEFSIEHARLDEPEVSRIESGIPPHPDADLQREAG